jgi:GNAT superfamily N-acetyltransferase
MNENIALRFAAESDIPSILSMIKELAQYEKLLSDVTANEEILRENLFGDKKFAEVIIAEFNGKPAGQALFFYNFSTFLGKPGLYLEDLYVKPEFRGKGVGKALFKKVIETAKNRKCGRVEWVVLDWNKPAIDFYKKIGAKPMDDWIIYRLNEDKF